MRESHPNKLSVTEPGNGFQPEAKSLFQNILGPKSLRLKILPGLTPNSRPQAFRNEDFTESDDKKCEIPDMSWGRLIRRLDDTTGFSPHAKREQPTPVRASRRQCLAPRDR